MRRLLGVLRAGTRQRALRPLAAAVALAAAAAPAIPAIPAVVTVQDDSGQRSTLARPPQRIVSLMPSLTEAVCALQACERLVGVDRFSDWPARVQQLPRLGGLEDTPIDRQPCRNR